MTTMTQEDRIIDIQGGTIVEQQRKHALSPTPNKETLGAPGPEIS
jgi:hypothetical protein